KKAFILLEQIVNDAQLLRLPENRVNVQIDIADLLWDSNQTRARTLFATAGDGIAEIMRTLVPNEERRGPNPTRTAAQLRQKLVLTVARHESALAYQLLAATRPAPSQTTEGRNSPAEVEENLEQMLLARITALDPKMALQNAEELLDKGQFPRSLTSVLAQLQRKDKEAAAKLEDKMLKRLQAANLLSSEDAGSLAVGLLRPGPRTSDEPAKTVSTTPNNNPTQFLAQSAYVDLLGTVIDAALKAVPQPRNQRAQNNPRGRRNVGAGGGSQTSAMGTPTAVQIEQANARALMNGVRSLLPQIDQYLASRAPAVREKLTELGMSDNNQRAAMNQVANLMRQGSADNLLTAAKTAPPQMQSRIYQRAALKALEEGNADRARQIASDYLEGASRDRVLQQVEFRQISEKTDATRLGELRSTLYSLRSDEERVDLLVQLSFSTRQNNPKLAVQLLDQATQLTNRRAANYRQFEQQLKVAEAFRELEPSRSFEVLEPGIAQLNELLSAAAVLSGFEVNVFRDGELPLEARNNLSGMITRFGQALGVLARTDFDRAQTLANRFLLTEPRILARIAIVQGLLGNQPSAGIPNPGVIGAGNSIRPPE
ncbi:MAG TPA: hypothetical protein VJ180_16190, partial [Pyrinomonadaceae bacterium]|nr:hypothetical protein [Pyrinomonadaceae bacterium]